MKKDNPFSKPFLKDGRNAIPRLKEAMRISEIFDDDPSGNALIITGAKRSGKTVFLSELDDHFKANPSWTVIHLGDDDGIPEKVEQGKGILLTIDGLESSDKMTRLKEIRESLMNKGHSVFVLASLSFKNINRLKMDKDLAFLYRAPKIILGPLNLGSFASRYKQYLGADEGKSVELAKLTKGYAYAYQVLGYLLYEKGDLEVDDALLSEYDQYLVDYVYDNVYSDLSASEQKILSVFEGDDPVKISEICKKASMSNERLSVYRDRLLKNGIVYAPSYGYLALSLPRFDAFLKQKRF